MKPSVNPIGVGLCLTLFMGLYSIYYCQVINHDAVLYLRAADTFLAYGLQYAYHLYHWPFYSLLIGMVSQILGISTLNAGYLLNLLCQMGITALFISLVKDLGGHRRTQWFALIVIVLFPAFQGYRAYIVRDFGYWFFYLLAIKASIQFVDRGSWKSALWWGGSMVMATLFRIEGLAFFLFQPLIILIFNQETFWNRCRSFLKMNTVLIVVLIAAGAFLILSQHNLWQLGRFNNVHDVLNVEFAVKKNILHIADVLSTYVLNQPGRHDAIPMAVFSIIGLIIYKIIKIINPIYSLLVGFAIVKGHGIASRHRWQIFGYLLINFILVAYFAAVFNFLSSRYVMGFALTAILWVPFGLDRLYQRYAQQNSLFAKRPFVASGMVSLVFLAGIYGLLHKTGNKFYLKEASLYLKPRIGQSQTIYTNSPQLLYEVKGASLDWDNAYDPMLQQLKTGKLKQYDFYVILLSDTFKEIKLANEQFKNLTPTIFKNHHGDQVVIYRANSKDNEPLVRN